MLSRSYNDLYFGVYLGYTVSNKTRLFIY